MSNKVYLYQKNINQNTSNSKLNKYLNKNESKYINIQNELLLRIFMFSSSSSEFASSYSISG